MFSRVCREHVFKDVLNALLAVFDGFRGVVAEIAKTARKRLKPLLEHGNKVSILTISSQ